MAEEFVIKSNVIEDKINQLLPSQGGFQPGVDFSASTMVVPIIDLTETAEGSTVREDLQTASSFSSSLSTATNATVTVTTTTGYFKLIGSYNMDANGGGSTDVSIFLDDGVTQKTVFKQSAATGVAPSGITQNTFNLVVFASAGKSIKIKSTGAKATINCSSHQIADLLGNLTDPT